MEKFLQIVLNPYVFIVVSSLLIIGLTQLIKLIPCFKDNNWNVAFPVLLGFIAAFGWGIATKLDIKTNIEILLGYGTGITTLSTFLYSILKKIFSKEYKLSEALKNNKVYSQLSTLFTQEIVDFNKKNTIERYGLILSVVGDLKNSITKLASGDKDGAKAEAKVVLSKFVKIEEASNVLDSLIENIKTQYKIPEIKKEEVKEIKETSNLTKPQ